MRIGIDVRYLSHGLVGGIHTYLENFIPALINVATDHQIILYADTKKIFELTSIPKHVKLHLLPYRNQFSSFLNDIMMKNLLTKDHLDIIHFTASYGFGPRSSKVIVTLQDEINILPLSEIYRGHKKNVRTITMMSYLHFCTQASLKKASKIITVSEYSKRQIARYGPCNPDKIVVIPHACPHDIQMVSDPNVLDDVKLRFRITKPFILGEAFKNPAVIIRAWHQLPSKVRDQHEIIFFSRSPEVLPIVQQAVDDGFAKLLIRPARRDLSALLSSTEVFVFPSWIEGFGIPLLEAMTCGAPIIASDRGSIPSVVGNAARLIDAEDDKALAAHLIELLTVPSEREKLRQAGFERLCIYSWPNIAKQALTTYEGIV